MECLLCSRPGVKGEGPRRVGINSLCSMQFSSVDGFRSWNQLCDLVPKKATLLPVVLAMGEQSALPSQKAAVSQLFGATFRSLNQWELTVGILLQFASFIQLCICEFYSCAAVASPFLLLYSILVHGINTIYRSCFD